MRFDALAGGLRHLGRDLRQLGAAGSAAFSLTAWRLADALEDDAWNDWRKAPGPGTIGSIVVVRGGGAEPQER